MRADPASHGFGIMKAPGPSCSPRNRIAFSFWVALIAVVFGRRGRHVPVIFVAEVSPAVAIATERLNMASTSIPKDRVSARVALVEQHIRLENEHDLEGVLRTFGDAARYDDEAWGEHYEGDTGGRRVDTQVRTTTPGIKS